MTFSKSLSLFFHILSGVAIAAVAFELPLSLVLELDEHLVSVIYISVTVIFLIDFINNLLQYRKQKTNDHISEVLDQEHTPFLLVVDIIAAIPFGLFSLASYVAILQLVKIIRIAQYQSAWNKRAVRFADYQKLGFFIFWILIATHWLACGWLALHYYPGITDKITLYTRSLYWSVVTLTTVGYGDIVPTTNIETAYSMIVMLFGVGIYGYVIGNIAHILSKRDPARVAFQNNIDNLKSFVRYRDIPTDLQLRIRDYYAYLYKKRVGYDESVFLNSLPSSIKHEVEQHLKRKIIDKIPIFTKTTESFLNDIAHQLKPVIFTPGDIIIREGDEGHEMYLVIKGELIVYKNENPDQKFYLKEGDFFGELALLNNKPRNANVMAITYVDLYVLKRDVFEFVLSRHPELAKKIQDTAATRIKK